MTSTRLYVHVLPILTDNYVFVLEDTAEQRAVVIDPGDAAPVLAFLAERGLELAAIWLTHHHADHIGGVADLVKKTSAAVVGYGNDTNRLPPLSRVVDEGDILSWAGEEFAVWHLPAHTLGHIAYVQQSPENPALLCGDTLFLSGCGRLFEGTPAMLLAAMDRIAALPDSTRIYCTHEYTATNVSFTRSLEADSHVLSERLMHVSAMRSTGHPTVPGLLATERGVNPFLRAREAHWPAVLGLPADADAVTVIAELRTLRNGWKSEI